MRSTRILFTLGAAVAFASPAAAQGRGHNSQSGSIPPGQMPPAGMCRVWIDGVPPGRQPAPTDCATALATRPANARVIYGDDSRSGKGGKYNKRNRDRDRDGDEYDRNRQQSGYPGTWGIDPRTGRPTLAVDPRTGRPTVVTDPRQDRGDQGRAAKGGKGRGRGRGHPDRGDDGDRGDD